MFVELKPREERPETVDEVIARLRPVLAQIPGVRVFMVNQPPINLGGGGGGQRALYQFTMQDTDTAELYKWAPVLEAKVRQMPASRT
jgi:HAE1 family hydrophobic/amphiphilic exporter-1